MARSAEKLFEWPLCGVAERKSRCSKSGVSSRMPRVNWESKGANLVSLAEELDLGLDSFIFVDDNPKEVEPSCAEEGTSRGGGV